LVLVKSLPSLAPSLDPLWNGPYTVLLYFLSHKSKWDQYLNTSFSGQILSSGVLWVY
jgi:hypothetical protein